MIKRPARAEETGRTSTRTTSSANARFVEAYGLTDRHTILPALQHAKLRNVERVKYAPIGPAGAATTLEYIAGQLRWLEGISVELAPGL
jgi:hypothetical protein